MMVFHVRLSFPLSFCPNDGRLGQSQPEKITACNVVNPRISIPFGNYFINPFMVIVGIVWDYVHGICHMIFMRSRNHNMNPNARDGGGLTVYIPHSICMLLPTSRRHTYTYQKKIKKCPTVQHLSGLPYLAIANCIFSRGPGLIKGPSDSWDTGTHHRSHTWLDPIPIVRLCLRMGRKKTYSSKTRKLPLEYINIS